MSPLKIGALSITCAVAALCSIIFFCTSPLAIPSVQPSYAQPSYNSTYAFPPPDYIAVPSWVRNNTSLWADGKLDDSQFILGIRYLAANGVISLPSNYVYSSLENPIPPWIKAAARWWSGGQISDYEFLSEIQYLTLNGEIRLGPPTPSSALHDSATLKNNFPTSLIKLDNVTVAVQVADTPDRMTEGLQFQQPLPYSEGMIFVFGNPQGVSMWMKDMQFPLDMIWFDKEGRVLHIEKNLQPCVDGSLCQVYNGGNQDTKYVLEVTAGFADKFNITEKSRLVTTG